MQQYQGNKECFLFFLSWFFFFKSAADQNTLLLRILSNPYILNTKTNIKAVIVSGNFARCNVIED